MGVVSNAQKAAAYDKVQAEGLANKYHEIGAKQGFSAGIAKTLDDVRAAGLASMFSEAPNRAAIEQSWVAQSTPYFSKLGGPALDAALARAAYNNRNGL